MALVERCCSYRMCCLWVYLMPTVAWAPSAYGIHRLPTAQSSCASGRLRLPAERVVMGSRLRREHVQQTRNINSSPSGLRAMYTSRSSRLLTAQRGHPRVRAQAPPSQSWQRASLQVLPRRLRGQAISLFRHYRLFRHPHHHHCRRTHQTPRPLPHLRRRRGSRKHQRFPIRRLPSPLVAS